MKKFFRSMLTSSGEISLGSVCIFVMVVAYTVIMVCAFFMGKKLPVSGYEFASIVGAIYGIKKGSTVASEYYAGKTGGKIDASTSD